MVQEKIVYNNNGFQILECDRLKDYRVDVLNSLDKVYRIKVVGVNQPTFDDMCETIYYLLRNKVFDNAFLLYKNKVLDAVRRAESDRLSLLEDSKNKHRLDYYM